MKISFKEQCIALRKEGYSIGSIMRITGRPKTSIYQHIRTIPLTAQRREEIRKRSADRIREQAIRRRGVPQKPFVGFPLTPNNVELVAHLIFDGGIRRKGCEYNSRSAALVHRVERLMSYVYQFPPKRYVNRDTGVCKLGYYNVALGSFIQEKSKELLKRIVNDSLAHKKEFLRAFFDDEGCMDFRPQRNVRQIRGYQKDQNILVIIQSLLSDFGIEARIHAPNEVVIRKRENLLRFQEQINFSPGVRINGNRTNSVWRKSFEKRNLLARAIKSYKG